MRQHVIGDAVSAKVLLKRDRDRHNTYSRHMKSSLSAITGRHSRAGNRLQPRAALLSSAVVAEFSAAQLPVLPKLEHRQQNDGTAKHKVPIPERATISVTKNKR